MDLDFWPPDHRSSLNLNRKVIRFLPIRRDGSPLPHLDAVRDHYRDLWNDTVTKHFGSVEPRCLVFLDGKMHRHDGFVVGNYGECELCYRANKHNFEISTQVRATGKERIDIRYELEITRRVNPRRLVNVPLEAPANKNPRIAKKWKARAAGRIGYAYQTETIYLQLSWTALRIGRKAYVEQLVRRKRK
jgi:hypothetical protein